jgi:hypothetical protein
MLKVKQQMEAESALEMEKVKVTQELASGKILAQKTAAEHSEQAVAAEAKAEADKKANVEKQSTEKKAAEEKSKVESEKKAAEAASRAVEEKKAAEAKAKVDAEKAAAAKVKADADAKVLAEKKEKESKKGGLVEKMNKELDQFSVTLNKKHFDAAAQIHEELKNDGFDDVTMKIHTNDIYKKSFTFPQIAHNDFAVDQFESLAVAEQNLNNDPNSDNQFDQFLKTADEVASNLKDRYKDQWIDPKDDRAATSE